MSPMHHRLRSFYALLFALAATFAASNVFAQNAGAGGPDSQLTADGVDSGTTVASQWVQFIEDLLPDWLVTNSFVTVKIWQWIGLGGLVLLGLALDLFLRALLSGITRRAVKRRGGQTSDETLAKTVRPFGLLAAGALWLFALPLLELPTGAADVLLAAVSLFVTLAGVWSAYRITDLLSEFFASKAERTDTKVDDLLIPLLRKTAKIFVTAFGLVYIAKALTIDIGPLLAGLGIGGIGFAFAARDTLENFFGSITVIVDRPFQIGDWVQIGDTQGTVEDLGFRSTRIRTPYNSLVTIPNGNLVRAVVDNYGKRKYRRFKTHLGLTYDTPPAKIEAFCEGVRELIRRHPFTRKDYYHVWLNEFSASSLDVLVYMFYETPDYQTELRERHRLLLDIIRLADRLGVQFAFPTQTLHMFSESHEAAHTPAPPPETDTHRQAEREGQNAVRELVAKAQWRGAKPAPYVISETPSLADDDDETQIETKIDADG